MKEEVYQELCKYIPPPKRDSVLVGISNEKVRELYVHWIKTNTDYKEVVEDMPRFLKARVLRRMFLEWLKLAQPYELEDFFNSHELMEMFTREDTL